MKSRLFLTLVLVLSLASLSHAAEEDKGFFGFFKKDTKTEAKQASAPAVKSAAAKPAAAKAGALSKQGAQETAPVAKNMKAANLEALMNRMANNKMMTDAEKESLSAEALKYIDAAADVKAPELEQDTLRFEQIVNDPNMKVADKKAEIQKYFSQPRETAKVRTKSEPAAAEETEAAAKKEIQAEFREAHQTASVEVKKEAVAEKKEAKTELKKETKRSGNFARKS